MFKIIKIGNPSLREISTPINESEFGSTELDGIVAEMHEAMQTMGGAGIAAPQVSYNRRLIMFGFENNSRYPNAPAIPFTILCNPTYIKLSDAQEEAYEGCLSVGDLRAPVNRFSEIEYSGITLSGETVTRTANGFHARLLQHEIDHLDGILFLDRVTDNTRIGFVDELETAGILTKA